MLGNFSHAGPAADVSVTGDGELVAASASAGASIADARVTATLARSVDRIETGMTSVLFLAN
jgi:hypothetical protein